MFPKRKYAKTGGHVVVDSEHQERMLGDGWYDNPPAPPAEQPAATPPEDPKKSKKGK